MREHFVESGQWLIKSIVAFADTNAPHNATQGANNFLIFYKSAPPADQAKLKAMWDEAGLPPLPDPEAEEEPRAT